MMMLVFGDLDAHALEYRSRCVTIAGRGIARDPPIWTIA
jgi:hypothetical protein